MVGGSIGMEVNRSKDAKGENGMGFEPTEERNVHQPSDGQQKTENRHYLESLLNQTYKIKISDGRTLIGSFLCTDKEQNIILGQCQEYVTENGFQEGEEPRALGLAMVPGRHIVSIHVDTNVPEFRTAEYPLGKVNFVADIS